MKIVFKVPGVLIYQHPDKVENIFIRRTKTLRKPIVLFSIEGKQKTSRDLFQSPSWSIFFANDNLKKPQTI